MKSVRIKGIERVRRDLEPKIFRNRAKRASDIAVSRLIEVGIKDTDPYVPYDTGKTSGSVKRLPNSEGWEYTTDYAKFAFDPIAPSGKKKVYKTDVHEKAQGNPIQASFRDNKEKWLMQYWGYFYEEFYKKQS